MARDLPMVPSTTCLKMAAGGHLRYLGCCTGLLTDDSFEAWLFYRFHVAPVSPGAFRVLLYVNGPSSDTEITVTIDGANINILVLDSDGAVIINDTISNPNPEIDTWHTLKIFCNGAHVWLESETDSLADVYHETSIRPLLDLDTIDILNNTSNDVWVDEIYFENIDSWPM